MSASALSQSEHLLDLIDPGLAQTIVDRSMGIIDSNVNVMNRHGIIIASGDRSRIGHSHEGALLVLAREAAVEIGPQLAQQLGGALPGVNLPLRVGGAIVGCVGLTGSVRVMRPYAELVRIAAETMLEQARLTRLVMRDARLREDLVLAIAKRQTSHQALTDMAAHLGIDLSVLRVAAVAEIVTGDGDPGYASRQIQDLASWLDKSEAAVLSAPLSTNRLVLLLTATIRKGHWSVDAQKERTTTLAERINQSFPVPVRMSLGRCFPDPADLGESCRTAVATLDVGKKTRPASTIHFYDELKLNVLLDEIRHGWRGEEIAAPLRPLMNSASTDGLLQTLKSWFGHNMHRGRCAAAMGIHRNTLDYRLRRIEEICDVDLGRTDHILTLYLALQLSS